MKTRADKPIPLDADQKGTPEGRRVGDMADGIVCGGDLAGCRWEGQIGTMGAACRQSLCCPFDEPHRGVEAIHGPPGMDPRVRGIRNG